jgi:hypothetical protein
MKMKNVFFKAASGLLCFLISCNAPSNRISDQPSASQAEKNLAKEHALLKGIETGDLSGLDTILVDPYMDYSSGEKPMARDSIRKILEKIHENIPNIKFTILAESATADNIFYLSRATGTTIAPSMGWPANTKIDQTAVGFVKVKNGMFVEHRGFFTPQDILKLDSLNKISRLKPNKETSKSK